MQWRHRVATFDHIEVSGDLALLGPMDNSTFLAAVSALMILYAAAWIALGKLMQGPPA
jgi:hypothetical protein